MHRKRTGAGNTGETPAPEKPEKTCGTESGCADIGAGLMGGIGAVIYLKFVKKKPQSANPHDPDDYEYDEEGEIPDEEEIELEDGESGELDADGDGGEESENKTV